MAYDEALADRVRTFLAERPGVVEKKMFGGLCFMVSGHMCCGITGDMLMARVGPDIYERCLQDDDAGEMDFTGKPLKGMVYVAPEGIGSDTSLHRWLSLCTQFTDSLPPK